MYTDTASRAGGGNRLFVTRSKDPAFSAHDPEAAGGREEWQGGRFVPYPNLPTYLPTCSSN